MYIWIGCKLPAEFDREIRTHCLALNEQVGLDTAAFVLPRHISLKISFQTDRPEEVLENLADFVSAQSPFFVRIAQAQQFGNILWLPVEENTHLDRLHKALDSHLESRFGIPQHQFDRYFMFHSTLFMDEDTDKIAQMCGLLKNYPAARELQVDTFLLGQSETGKPGTYRVVREIKV